jgi:hypothetical protein
MAAVVVLGLADAARAQVTIDHKQVGCIVAGQYSRLNACFTPASEVVRPRVNFRMKAQPAAYYVEMKSDMPCHQAFLPRPKKELIGQEIELWIEGMDRAFNPARTPEYAVTIVGSESECKKDLPVAPWVSSASVTVFPAMPAGFVAAGAFPATAVLAVVGGGAAAATGIAIAASGDDEPPVAGTPTSTTSTTTTTTTTTTTLPPSVSVDCTIRPRSGPAPLTVSFSAVPIGFTGPVSFRWDFGDGTGSTDRDTTHTYTSPGVFRAIVTATSGAQSATCDRNVSVSRPDEVRHALDVALTGTGTGTVTSNPSGISCAPDCVEVYPRGTVVTLTPTPAASSVFVGWSGSCSGAGPCTLTMNGDHAVTAKFDLKPVTLTVTMSGAGVGSVAADAPPGGVACPADCTETYTYGTTVTLRATPQPLSTFITWSGGGCLGTLPCTLTLTADTTVDAFFDRIPVTLTVTTSGAGTGTVTADVPPGGITCPGDCTETYPAPQTVTLRAAPQAGSTFAGWSGGGCTGTGACTTTLTASATVNAQFDLIPRATLTVTISGDAGAHTVSADVPPGGIACPGDCSEAYNVPTSVTLRAAADATCFFAGWSGGGCSGTATCVVNLTADTTVDAAFGCVSINGAGRAPADDEGNSRIVLRHQLDAGRASGQILLNGATVAASSAALNPAQLSARAGDNRVEARLTRDGVPGTWRFDLGSNARLEPGTLRVLAGEPVTVSGDAVVFRVQGKIGEQVIFTFRLKP